MRRTSKGVRLAAGAFLLLGGRFAAADPLRLAAERPDAVCPAGRILSIVHPDIDPDAPPAASKCIAIVSISDLSDASLEGASERIAKLPPVAGVVLEFEKLPPADQPDFAVRIPYAVKKLASEARAAAPGAEIALDLTADLPAGAELRVPAEDLGPYAEALVLRPGRGSVEVADVRDRWILAPRGGGPSAADAALRHLDREAASASAVTLIGLLVEAGQPLSEADWKSLERLQAYWSPDASRDPTPTTATLPDGSTHDILRFFDARTFTPILFLPAEEAGSATLSLMGGPYAQASVENLDSGARRDFDVKGAATLSLDVSKGPLAIVLRSAARPEGEAHAAVEVGAGRSLTAEEIVARERTWDAGQRERVGSFTAEMDTSLRFRIAEVNETFDLTIQGTFFFERGKDPDWVWRQFYLNGVRWKGRELPKLPILQPEKVTTLPLDILLTEDYAYVLKKQTRIAGRRAYEISYAPKASVGSRAIYRGTVWIDTKTFALLRRTSIQMNLTGETLSNIQDEYYRPVPGRPEVFLPLLIRGQQVFSTAGRTTAIERRVAMTHVEINPASLEARKAEAYASQSQIVRDTGHGLRYLLPDPANPGGRIVEEKVSRKSTFGLLGGFYDKSLDYPIPLIGLQHFNFDLWGKGKQISILFGGVLLTANYTDPSFLGSRFDLGADLFAVAIPFKDVAYRDGQQIPGENVKHVPADFQINFGRPLGPYLKASLGIFTKWDDFQRDSATQSNFVTPADTFTNGAEIRLVANYSGFNATLTGTYASRVDWTFWGVPGNPDYSPDKKDYWKFSASLSKDQYFPGFRKFHVSVTYLGGFDLDRFSKYEFGSFSGNAINGYASGALRSQDALLMNLSYGINIEDIIRFEGFYDQALLWDALSGFHGTYFSGAGLLASLNGPFANSLIRGQIGTPVVSHGVHGVVVNVTMLKLF